MEFRILGPLEVVEGDRQISLGGRKPRALLAMLILRRGQIVSVDELVEALWGDDQPKTAEHSVQVYVSELRKALGDAADASTVVEHRDPGYALDVPDAEIDLHRFEGLRALGRAALERSASGAAPHSPTSPTTISLEARSNAWRSFAWPPSRIGSMPTSPLGGMVSSWVSCAHSSTNIPPASGSAPT
jgi:DNA-binding winged helix-turn-helix (wHTH) protein